jgi:FkbO/Hyg5 family chorismatase
MDTPSVASMATGPLQSIFTATGHAIAANRQPQGHALAQVHFGTQHAKPSITNGVLSVHARMARDGGDAFTERWFTQGPVTTGADGDVVHAHDEQILFVAAAIDIGSECTDATRLTYLKVFELTERLGYTRLFRMWNLIPRITQSNAVGLEIYQDFCRGRAEAFERRHQDQSTRSMPAATGIGAHGDHIVLYLLAARDATVTHFENPRQVPAYRYPQRYGPKSPSFARATHVSTADGRRALYVSGTASIVGHETVHVGDVEAQCHEALANIAYLIGADNFQGHGLSGGCTLHQLDHIKVYVRHASDLEAVRRIAEGAFNPKAEVRYLIVDICRADLLVEIEGWAAVPSA